MGTRARSGSIWTLGKWCDFECDSSGSQFSDAAMIIPSSRPQVADNPTLPWKIFKGL